MIHQAYRDKLFAEFARIGGALASDKRLALLEILAQGPRHVDALAAETGATVANTSQHLQVLKQARLVETERAGTKILYRLADGRVLDMWLALRSVAESQLAEVEQVKREFAVEGSDGGLLTRDRIEEMMRAGEVCLIDTRPLVEYESGHLSGAISVPVEELPERLDELPRDKPIVAYCRGEYCLLADEAVATLRRNGFDAHRVEGGWPEWLTEGRPVSV
jgi:rhodanese-related sulfurtransferase/DNA-binding transcriptional ArsR family regulator